MKHPNDAVNQLFVSSDQRDWNMVEQIFDDNVLLDYSSMSGNPAASLTPEAITTAWKGVLPGFEYTHHQIGNMLTTIDDNTAKVFCYGTATHYLTDEEGNVWTVVGSYDFDLRLDAKDNWRVTSMKFNFKYQDGNTSLPEKAINRLK
ncbi:MAG: nuclear transport factor 2 family protein [Bacteroidota bacterium]